MTDCSRQPRTVDCMPAVSRCACCWPGCRPRRRAWCQKRAWLRAQHDDIRRFLMLEPRGHADMYGACLFPPGMPGTDSGVIFLHDEGYEVIATGQRDACQAHSVYRVLSCAQTVRAGKVDVHAEPVVEADGSAVVRVDARFARLPPQRRFIARECSLREGASMPAGLYGEVPATAGTLCSRHLAAAFPRNGMTERRPRFPGAASRPDALALLT